MPNCAIFYEPVVPSVPTEAIDQGTEVRGTRPSAPLISLCLLQDKSDGAVGRGVGR